VAHPFENAAEYRTSFLNPLAILIDSSAIAIVLAAMEILNK